MSITVTFEQFTVNKSIDFYIFPTLFWTVVYTHLVFHIRTASAICKLNVSGFRCHALPVIFSCYDAWKLQTGHILIVNTHWFVEHTIWLFIALRYSSRYFSIVAN